MRAPKCNALLAACSMTVAVTALLSCSRQSDHQESTFAAPPNVSTVPVVRRSISRELELAAVFQPYQEVDIHGKVSGYIRQINVDIGDRVRRGQVLATLEVPELQAQVQGADAGVARSQSDIKRLQNEVSRAEASYTATHANFQRLKSAFQQQPGLIAAQELDDAEARDRSAAAQVDAARSSVASAQQQLGISRADLQRIHTLAEYATITAPFSGVVTARYADTGSLIPAGTSNTLSAQPVVRLAQSNVLRLRMPVPEQDIPLVREGEQVIVRVQATNQTFTGTIVRYSREVSNITRTMLTEIDVKNPELELAPGMYANAMFTLQKKNDALVVPSAAVLQGGQPTVWVVDKVGHAQPRIVTLGIASANAQEILSGLEVGDQVVIGAQSTLQAGENVHVACAHRISQLSVAGGTLMSFFAIKYPFFILMVCLMVVVVGTVAILRMPVDLFPRVDIPVVVVATFYSGMPPQQIESDITNSYERFFTLGSNIDHIESRSMSGVSLIKIYFQPGTDANAAVSNISNLAMANLRRLPPGTLPPSSSVLTLPICPCASSPSRARG